MKIQKKTFFGGGRGLVGGGGGQGGCESRIEVFLENSEKKNWGGGSRGGVSTVIDRRKCTFIDGLMTLSSLHIIMKIKIYPQSYYIFS